MDPLTANSPVSESDDGITVAVSVWAGAKTSRIGGTVADADGRFAVKIAVTGVAEGGRTNAAVISLLAKSWRVPKSSIAIRSGASARRKIPRIKGDARTLKRRIEGSMKESGNG